LDRGSRSATGSTDGSREADVWSAESRANRRPKGSWSGYAQEFWDVGWLLGLCSLAAQLPLQLFDALARAVQLLELSLLANYLT
jgi:hypothetical protein